MTVNVGKHIESLKMQFKRHEMPKLKKLIRSVIVLELNKIEGRKQARRWIAEYKERKKEEDEEAAEAEMQRKMNEQKGSAFNANRTSIMDNVSRFSSPTRMSPARSRTFTGAVSEYGTVSN